MWNDRPNLLKERAEFDYHRDEEAAFHYVPLPKLHQYDHDLWRAKLRTNLGSLTGILDGIDVCREHQIPLPGWLNDHATHKLAILGSKSNFEAAEAARYISRYRKETNRLREAKRADTLHRILHAERIEVAGGDRTDATEASTIFYFSKAQVQASERAGLELNPRKMTQDYAAELANIVLRETWSVAEPASILKAYKKARAHFGKTFEIDEATVSQVNYLGWDVQNVRPNTLRVMGLI